MDSQRLWSKLLWNPRIGDRVFDFVRRRYGVLTGQITSNVFFIRFDGCSGENSVFHQEMRPVRKRSGSI